MSDHRRRSDSILATLSLYLVTARCSCGWSETASSDVRMTACSEATELFDRHATEMEALDTTQCQAIAAYGSRNYDSPAFGPDDPCDRDALPGSDYCGEHQGWDR